MKVLLIGNYAGDEQQSMLRYADLLREGLTEAGHDVTLAAPEQRLKASGPSGIGKWIGYIDKFILSPRQLARAARRVDVVHVCDHSNAMYVPMKSSVPYVATCHDLLAVRGAMGEVADCPASPLGQHLQRAILRGLRRAHGVACVSAATMHDAKRLLDDYRGKLVLVPNSLNYPYRRLDAKVIRERMGAAGLTDLGEYVLCVGSNQKRKNRECALHAIARIRSGWNGRIVFAGAPLDEELRALASRLGVTDRIVEAPNVGNELLEALYNGALALLFPSRFEGFGWPMVEAQACGCPVICSDRMPMPEVSGGAAILCGPDDHAAFAQAILALSRNPQRRDELVRAGYENAARFDRPTMIRQFVALYEDVVGRA
jgi:glycosyltransferase involved in cell wall biosynthesis